MNQRSAATFTVAPKQSMYLPDIHGQDRRPKHHVPSTSQNLSQHFDPLQLPSTHRHQAHAFQTFQLGREVTFLLGRYNSAVHKMRYRT